MSDGKVAGVREGLRMAPGDRKIPIPSDPQAAISAMRKVGRTGKARAANLKWQ